MKEVKQKYLTNETNWKYTAVDSNGDRFYYTELPAVDGTYWTNYTNLFPRCALVGETNCCYASGKKDWKKSLRKLKKTKEHQLVFMDFLEKEGVKEIYLENCKTKNQRWDIPECYYYGLHNVYNAPPMAWFAVAFDTDNVDDNILWNYIKRRWQKLISDTNKPVLWETKE